MRNVFILFALGCCLLSFAQVGIGTAMPDPSSLLDVSSTTQGILAPRMTTEQRLAIASPANGLLVYDTTVNRFFFFENAAWESVGTAQRRDHYKLVKNIADLADELAAGSDLVYELNTNYLYEINGTISFDKPININGAYIEGVDSSEDRLFNNAGEALFQGSTSGSIRNITILGNGSPVFEQTGATGTELFIINNTIVAGASTVGSFNGLGTVFFSITQFVNNTDGFEITDIGSFFVSNIFWTASNTGTFMDLRGSFADLQMNGGRIEADGTEVGIDVSTNPSITNDATLSQLSFVGDGTFVNPYTVGSFIGFNFTNDWNVNCSGIPLETDQVATANFYYGGALNNGYVQNIDNGNPVQIKSAADFVANGLFRFEAADNNNDVIYKGKQPRNVQVNASLSIRVGPSPPLNVGDANGDFYAFSIAKNGTIVVETNSVVQIASATQIQNVALNGILFLEPDDVIEIFVTRLTGTGLDRLSVFSENLSVR